jgi:hypothetical protein
MDIPCLCERLARIQHEKNYTNESVSQQKSETDSFVFYNAYQAIMSPQYHQLFLPVHQPS